MNLRPESALLRALVDAQAWKSFFLIDVGASGGIGEVWRAFGASLRAVGLEPLIAEVDRLNREEQSPRVTYEAAFVSSPDFDRLFPPELRKDPVRSRTNDAFKRVSAVRATEIMSMDYVRDVFNRGARKAVANRTVSLDEYVQPAEYPAVDFVKIDTDGHDFEVLLGARKLLQHGVLGLLVESQLHGASHEHANTFANIDRYLRDLGFSLFDLELYKYSRSALPAPFVYDIPAQTEAGQVLWGDALYLRDLGDPLYENKHPFEVTRDRMLKLAGLYSLFGLPDCAAELLTVRSAVVGGTHTPWLNLAAKDAGVPGGDYAGHLAAFERNPRDFYPTARQPQPQPESITAADVETCDERLARATAENERLKARLSKIKARLRKIAAKNARLRKKLEEPNPAAG